MPLARNRFHDDLTVVLMAKWPAPGAAKTRLVGPRYSAADAATIAWAMTQCLVRRLARGRLVLAVTPGEKAADLAGQLGFQGQAVSQGEGSLGQRMLNVWTRLNGRGPVAFLGVDSPDVPSAFLAGIPAALSAADVAIGPSSDGGYWALAARRPQPAILQDIDWGTDRVLGQTIRRAADADLVVAQLPLWYDVDEPDDVSALRSRLSARLACGRCPPDEAAAIRELLGQLDQI